jgi:hypothetical protein
MNTRTGIFRVRNIVRRYAEFVDLEVQSDETFGSIEIPVSLFRWLTGTSPMQGEVYAMSLYAPEKPRQD